jgi:hypothetical protein
MGRSKAAGRTSISSLCSKVRPSVESGVCLTCCSASDMETWMKALNIAIYGARGGGMFGTDLRTQIRREVSRSEIS